MVALSPIFSFTSFSIGGIILHGPHHSAEKSTSTGFLPFMISPKDCFSVVAINPGFTAKLGVFISLKNAPVARDNAPVRIDMFNLRKTNPLQCRSISMPQGRYGHKDNRLGAQPLQFFTDHEAA